jgi:DNA modification methylase
MLNRWQIDISYMEINQVHCGDAELLLAELEAESIDLTLTSPPYFNARDYSTWPTLEDYMEKMRVIFTQVFRTLKPSRMCVVNISPVLVPRESRSKQSYRIPLPYYYVPMMEAIGFEFLEDIIWKKPDGAAPNRNGGFFRHRKPVAYKPNIVTEYILVFKKPAPKLIDAYIRNESLVPDGYERTNVWEFNPETSLSDKHTAPFPEALAERVIRYYSYENDLVLDPFMGSGTTGRVARLLNRSWLGMELHQEYTDFANQRINT